jgi:hypothetical protein
MLQYVPFFYSQVDAEMLGTTRAPNSPFPSFVFVCSKEYKDVHSHVCDISDDGVHYYMVVHHDSICEVHGS